jgi:chromosome segregation protein
LSAAEQGCTAELGGLDAQIAAAEAAASREHTDDLGDVVARLAALRERGRGLTALLSERHRSVERQVEGFGDDSVAAALAEDAEGLRAVLATVDAEVEALAEQDREAAEAETAVDAERSAFEQEWADVRAGPTPAGEARGEWTALRRSIDEGRAATARLELRNGELLERASRLGEEMAAAELDVNFARRARAAVESHLGSAHDRKVLAEERLRVEQDHVDSLRRRAQAAMARVEALSQALAEAQGPEVDTARFEGALGSLRGLLDVDPGWEVAVEAALGEALVAVALTDVHAARSAFTQLNEAETPGAVIAVDAPLPPGDPPPDAVSLGAELVRTHVGSRSPGVERLLDVLLAKAVVVDTWQAAVDLVLAAPGLVAVTRLGDRFGPTGWRTGSGNRSMELALDGAREEAAEATAALAGAEERLAATRSELAAAQGVLAGLEQRMADHEARLSEASAVFGRLQRERAQVDLQLQALHPHLAELAERMAQDEARAARLEVDLSRLDEEGARWARRRAARDEAERHLKQRVAAAGALRTEVQVRAAALQERRELLSRQLRDVESRMERLQQGRELMASLQVQARATSRLAAMVRQRLVTIEEALASVQEQRRREQAARREADERLALMRRERSELERRLETLRAEVHETQLEEAEVRLRIESLAESVVVDLGCSAEVAMATELPELPSGVAAHDRLEELQRQLRAMGPVNPLALEEHQALQERQRFLDEQLEDVKSGRRELGKVIRSIDAEILQVFSAAYADVAENFAKLFATLFPGGSGSLHLTDPDHLLETGVEVEARPGGKNVRRLSLLSGGERALTALAFLFAVFRSRPSPFYLLDEVEAALDDVNLKRFLRLLDEFRQDAQLLVVTHQKRTMEAADCLYGVTMQPGGSSRVVSERVATPAGR